MNYLSIFLSILFVSLASLAGVVLLSMNKDFLKKIMTYLVSFATGALFANVFFHLLPEMVEHSTDVQYSFGLVLTGIIASFIIEKFVHWHHCHNLECSHHEPVGTMMLIGDAAHNTLDGMLIATAYLVNIELGIATTIAVLLHEIPQEIGDFAILLHSGMSRAKALLWNFISALTAFVGAGVVIALHNYVDGIELVLLPIVAGNFLYIAGSDLIPELHKETRTKNAILQLIAMLAGILLIFSLVSGGHAAHGEDTDEDVHIEEEHEESHSDHIDE